VQQAGLLTVIWDTLDLLTPTKNKEVVMKYRQITYEERYTLGLLRRQGLSAAAIARVLGRHRSTISREVRRNSTNYDGGYRPQLADWYANGRRRKSRRNSRFGPNQWAQVRALLCQDWSPEQVAGWLRRHRMLKISHETIYRHVWTDKRHGGSLYRHLRGSRKLRRKGYRSYDSRGRMSGKRSIHERPPGAENRSRVGHWETDTLLGIGQPCVLSMVERKTGFLLLGQLHARTTEEVNRRMIRLIRNQLRPVQTITADNGTEFHQFNTVERNTDARFYFADPYHSWERGTNENTNGLLRQYLPKRSSMASLTQHQCNAIANKLNRRPRKRLGYLTPEECYLS
jgi:IS30 family transposase